MAGENDKTAAAVPSQLKDVMLVPNTRVALPISMAKNYTVMQQNWIFGQQWLKKDPANRAVIELKKDGAASDFHDALRAAARMAHGREVILAVGHGGAGDFRGLSQTVFDTMPESQHDMSTHKLSITREVLDLPDVAEKKGGKWGPKRSGGGVIVTDPRIEELGVRHDYIEEAGKILAGAGVARLVILACNLGKDRTTPRFHERLAALLGVGVDVFSGLIAIAEASDGRATKEQLWVVANEEKPEANRPPSDDLSHESFHEVPKDRRLSAKPPGGP